MPRNGSGTYTLPANSFSDPVVATEIDAEDAVETHTDIETALTNSIAKDGQTVTTAAIPFAAGIVLPNANGLLIYDTDTSHQLSIQPGSNLTANRTLTLTTGDAARTLDMSAGSLTAGGGQYVFPASQNASADANTLDDYEEGTFTPTLGDGTNNYTLSTAEGYYTKFGNRVVWESVMVWSDIGSAGASQLQMGALPFTTANVGTYRASPSVGSFSGLDLTATLNGIKAVSAKNETIVKMERVNDNAAPTALPSNGSSATGWLFLSGAYRV